MKTLISVLLVFLFAFPAFAFKAKPKDLQLSTAEIDKLVRIGQKSVFADCYKYYEFDFFGQQLVQPDYEEDDQGIANRELNQFKDYIKSPHLKIRQELLDSRPTVVVPTEVESQCHEFARVAVEAAAIRTTMIINYLKEHQQRQ